MSNLTVGAVSFGRRVPRKSQDEVTRALRKEVEKKLKELTDKQLRHVKNPEKTKKQQEVRNIRANVRAFVNNVRDLAKSEQRADRALAFDAADSAPIIAKNLQPSPLKKELTQAANSKVMREVRRTTKPDAEAVAAEARNNRWGVGYRLNREA